MTEENILIRMANVSSESIDRQNRTLDVVLATETPVETYIIGVGVVDEVVLMRGIEIPKTLTMIDSHNRGTVNATLGSFRDFKVKGGELHARAYFASDEESVKTFERYADGHLTDFSVSAERLDIENKDGQRIVTRSRLIEGSAVIHGADPNSKSVLAMRAFLEPHKLRDEMLTAELKQKLIKRGLDENATDEQTMEFLDRYMSGAGGDGASAGDGLGVDDPITLERKRIQEIDEMCRSHNVDDGARKKMIDDGLTGPEVASTILRKYRGGVPVGAGQSIEHGKSDREKFYDAASDALTQRCISGAGLSPFGAVERAKTRNDISEVSRAKELERAFDKPHEGTQDLSYHSIRDIARGFLERSGVNCNGLAPQTIVERAMKQERFIERSGGAFHSTGSFTNILLNSASKTLLAAYDEAAVTYPLWVRTAPSAPNYLELSRTRFGELDDPEVVPEGADYNEAEGKDSKESYAVEKNGKLFSVTLEALVNDDLNALSRLPQMQGNSMRRRINRSCYTVLNANKALSDGKALFHTDHNNTGTDSLSHAALNTGFKKMMTQSGLNPDTILNIVPKFLLMPAALSDTGLQLIGSIADPTQSSSTNEDASRPAFNSGVVNLYGPNGQRKLIPIVDGQMDAFSETAYYFAADPAQVDTVELTFLQGEEAPVLQAEETFKNDTMTYKIRQSFKAAGIDYRGLRRGNV